MRSGWTPTLEAGVRRPDPTHGLIAEAIVIEYADLKQRTDQWQAGDGPPSTADFEFRDDGGLALAATNAVALSNTTNDGYLKDTDSRRYFQFPRIVGGPFTTDQVDFPRQSFQCAKVVWGGTDDQNLEIQDVRAYLSPDVALGASTVVWWELHIYGGSSLSGDTGSAVTLTELCDPKRVLATAAAGDVTFDFSDRAFKPQPKAFETGQLGGPWTYFVILPLDATGALLTQTVSINTIIRASQTITVTTAANHGLVTGDAVTITGCNQSEYNHDFLVTVTGATTFEATVNGTPANGTGTMVLHLANTGWGRDSAVPSLTTAGNVLTSVRMTTFVDDSSARYSEVDLARVPTMRIRTGTYVAATITYSGANVISLDAAPTQDVEFAGLGETPGTTSILYEVSDDAGANWYSYTDGQLAVTDLPSVAAQQTYSMRATLNPGTNGSETPVLRALGARSLFTRSFAHLATVEGDQGAVDPVTLKGKIGEVTIRAIQDGVTDYLDAITQLLSEHYIGDIEWRIWVGPNRPDLKPRASYPNDWMLLDIYQIDDYTTAGGMVEITAISPLSLLKAALPVFDTGTSEREPLVYTQQTLQAAYLDIRDAQLGLAHRYIGNALPDATTRVSKTVTDSDVMVEMDALAFLAGYAHIASQGRLRTVDFMGLKSVVATLHREELKWSLVGPGFKNRIPEYFVLYDYDQTAGDFLRETRGYHTNAITNLGRGRIDAPTSLDRDIAQWIVGVGVTSVTSAATVATVTTANDHGLTTGDWVTIIGALQVEYNGDYTVTVTGATTFTYTFAGSGTSPATGTITCAILPHRIANRSATFFGPGVILLPFETQYAHPELEVGDMIAVETDRFIALDPNVLNRPIRGPVWLYGIIQEIRDLWGTKFTVWVRSYSSIIPQTELGDRKSILPRCKAYNSGNQVVAGAVAASITFDSELLDDGDLHSTSSATQRLTFSRAGRYTIVAQVTYLAAANLGALACVDMLISTTTLWGVIEVARYDLITAPAAGTFQLTFTGDFDINSYVYIRGNAAAVLGTVTIVGGVTNTFLTGTLVR